jgi:hypothetical protein
MNDAAIGQVLGVAVVTGLILIWALKGRSGGISVADKIKMEGGEVLSSASIGFLFSDPFKHATSDAAGLAIRTRYGDRTGTWFVRISSKRPEGEWLWVDDEGQTTLPVRRADDARVVPKVSRIPSHFFVIGFLVFIAGGVLIGLAIAASKN